jgi:hypothetical protein
VKKLPAPPQGNEFPVVPPKLLPDKTWGPAILAELYQWIKALPILGGSPTIIDAEFEINDDSPPKSDVESNWELSPDEERQIRRWKGIE